MRDLWLSCAQEMLKALVAPLSLTGNSKPYLEEFEIPVVHDCAHGHLIPLRECHRGQDVGPIIDEQVNLWRTELHQMRVNTPAARIVCRCGGGRCVHV